MEAHSERYAAGKTRELHRWSAAQRWSPAIASTGLANRTQHPYRMATALVATALTRRAPCAYMRHPQGSAKRRGVPTVLDNEQIMLGHRGVMAARDAAAQRWHSHEYVRNTDVPE
ncbi:hypothetical protein ACWEQA_35590 [Nocardia sp. NPDC004085]